MYRTRHSSSRARRQKKLNTRLSHTGGRRPLGVESLESRLLLTGASLDVTAEHLGGGAVQYSLSADNDLGGAIAVQITATGNIQQIPTFFFPDAPPDGGADLLSGQVDLAEQFDPAYLAAGGQDADSWWDNTELSTFNPPFNSILADGAVGGNVGSTQFSYSAGSSPGSDISSTRIGQIVILDPAAAGFPLGPLAVDEIAGVAQLDIIDLVDVGPVNLPGPSVISAQGDLFPITGSFSVTPLPEVMWDRVDPLGSLIFEANMADEIGAPASVFSDDFESGGLGPNWSTSSSTPNGRVDVSSVLGTPANSGSFHLAMDTSVSGSNNLNEAILTLDLSGVTDAEFAFAHKDVSDEDTPLPLAFVGSFNGDGVSISDDGLNWHTLVSLNNANSPNGVYTAFNFDLDAEAAAAGISLNSNFQIKFQQFDNFPFSTDGRTFDDIAITTAGALSDVTNFFLDGDQTLTVVAAPDDPAATLTATLRDPGNAVLATATATGPGETLQIQTIGIAADGDYTVEITGDVAGEFDLTLYRNAIVEVIDSEDGSEQDATGSFIPLGSGRFGIVGRHEGSSGDDGGNGGVIDILLIDDQEGGFGNAESLLAAEGHNVTEVFDEFDNGYVNLLSAGFLSEFEFVVYAERGGGFGAVLPVAVANSLENYIQAGGHLLVTGYDTLGSPTDLNLAGLVRSISPGDQVSGNPNWQTANIDNFILNGPHGDFRNLSFSATGYDDDRLIPDAAAGAVELATIPGASGRIIFTDVPGSAGSVGYWNGGNSGTTTNAQPDFTDGANPQNIFMNWAAGVGSLAPSAAVGSHPAAQPDVYGDPGEPGRFPPGPNVPAQSILPSELLVNGSFETGDFTGWTTVTTGSPFRPWAVTGGGQGGGFGMIQTQPQDGAFVAWNGFDGGGPMEFQMYQDVTIASGATATLNWMDRVQWNFGLGGIASLPRLYDVEIRDPATNAVRQNVFSFSTGTQATNPTGNTNWQSHSVDVSAFAGQTVRIFFREQIPQSFTGPGQIEFDAISLTEEAGATVETLYAGVGRGSPINPGGVLLVDETTGAGTLLADPITPGGLTGLDFDSNDRLWGTTIDGPQGSRVSNLVEIDSGTGGLISSVPILAAGTPISIGDLTIQPGTDTIYGVHSNADATAILAGLVYTIDRATGAATLVGDTFQERSGGLAFALDGTLYFAEFDELHTLDVGTGAPLTSINLTSSSHDGLGIRPSDGALFASSAGGGSDVIRIIDPGTGVSTALGSTGAGNASDLAFRVTVDAGGPDVDEYLLDLTGKAGQPIDIALSSDIDMSSGTDAQFNTSLTESNSVFFPNVLNFDFTGAPSPTGDAILDIDAIADLDSTSEFLTLDAEGIFTQDLFVNGGLQQQPVSTTVIIPSATLALLAADGTVSFTATPSSAVNNLGSNSLTLELTYATTSSGNLTLELLDTDGVTTLATGMHVSDNFDLGILDFVVPADGIYTVRVSAEAEGEYGIVVTDPLAFDTEPNEPSSPSLRSLDAYDGALGYLSDDTPATEFDLSLITSFESLSFPTDSGFIPPDPILAAGPSSVVAMVNTDIAIHNKINGSVIAQADLDGFGGFWATNNIVFDPWIVYDPDSDRFIAMGVDRTTGGSGSSRIYLAVSTDSTPTNLTTDWHKYIIDRTGTHTSTGGSTFPDYPKLGVDDDAIYITGNDFGILSGGFSHVSLFAIEKAPLLSGGAANIVHDEVINTGFSVHPVVNYDPGEPMRFAEAVGSTGIRLHTLSNVLTAPSRSTSMVGVPTYFFPPDVPQQGGPPLDSVSQRIMSGVVRDGSLWTAHAIRDPAVDAETVMRWYEFDISGPPSLVQSGNVDPGPGIHTWMGHINVDDDGDMAISFSMSGPNQFAGIGYTGRLASDPPGTTRAVETARAGEGSYAIFDGIGRNRWGDYSGLAIDPDGETFWLYNEYAAFGNDWGTFVGSFRIDPDSSGSLDVDTYEITLAAGQQIGLSTATPFDNSIDRVNLLDAALEVLDPSGVSVASDLDSGADGKNAAIPSFTAATAGVYQVIVSAEDDGDGEYVLDVNRGPQLGNDLLVSAEMIFENESVSLTGSYSDQDLADSHTVEIDWDDPNNSAGSTFGIPAINTLSVGDTFNSTTGSTQIEIVSLDLIAGEVGFEVTEHQYLDDGLALGNGTVEDESTISVTVTDDGGLFDASSSGGGGGDPTLVGYYDMSFGSGVAAQVAPIVAAGQTPVQIFDLSEAELAGIDVLFVQNPSNGGYGSEYLSQLSTIQMAVDDGLVLLLHDRFVTDAETILPGDSSLILSRSNPSEIVTFSYEFGGGDVLYSSIPLDFYLGGSSNFATIYAPNVVAYGASLAESPLTVLVKNLLPTGTTVSIDGIGTEDDKAFVGDPIDVTGTFSDGGLLDAHQVTVDWDDTTANSVFDVDPIFSANVANGALTQELFVGDTFSSADGAVLTVGAVNTLTGEIDFTIASHHYSTGGIFEIIVTVSDDDTGTDTATTQAWVFLELNIEIKPGGGPNPINLGAKGVLPVALLTTSDFDAATVDTSTLEFGDPDVVPRVSPLRTNLEDVDNDGDLDLIIHFSMLEISSSGAIVPTSTRAELTGFTNGGLPIAGLDSVRIVPPGDANNDLVVNAADYTIWSNNQGKNGAKLTDGDFNGDRKVDGADYTIWANNFGVDASAPATAATAVSSETESSLLAVDSVLGSAELNQASYRLDEDLLDGETNQVESAQLAIDRVFGNADINWALYLLYEDLLNDESNE